MQVLFTHRLAKNPLQALSGLLEKNAVCADVVFSPAGTFSVGRLRGGRHLQVPSQCRFPSLGGAQSTGPLPPFLFPRFPSPLPLPRPSPKPLVLLERRKFKMDCDPL